MAGSPAQGMTLEVRHPNKVVPTLPLEAEYGILTPMGLRVYRPM